MSPPDERKPHKYRRIADDLRASIQAGEYSPGRPLPGENDLMARYAVARMTVRQALAELQREGLAVARRGSGVYVAEVHPAERILPADDVPPTRTEAPEGVAAALALAPGDAVWVRSRSYALDGRPVVLSVSWAPDGLEDALPTRFREEVRARPAGPEEAARLELPPGAGVVALTRQAYAGEQPVRLEETVFPAPTARA